MKFSIHLGVLLSLWLSLLAAGPLRAQTGTIVHSTLVSGGRTRQYLVYVPKSYQSGKPVPLVVNLHGQNNTIDNYITLSNFRQVADTANFLLVYPQGLPDAVKFSNQTAWNAFETPNWVDDAGFIADLITKIEADYTIDAQRVYATGHSNGGFMTFVLAEQLSPRLAAVGVVSGAIGLASSAIMDNPPVRPVPVLEIHGTADDVVLYSRVADVMAKWAQINGCAPTPVIDTLKYTSTKNSNTTKVARSVWSTSAGTSPVVHEAVIGAVHNLDSFGNFGKDNTSDGDHMAGEIWCFLRKFRLPSPASPIPGANLALNKPVCSSALANSWLASSAAVDGNAVTRWASPATDAQWLTVDLGASYTVNEVKLTWQDAYGKDYNIQVSKDGLTWTAIKSVTGNTTLVNDLTGLAGTGRYVRLNGKARGTTAGYSLFELEVYGTLPNLALNKPVTVSSSSATTLLGPNAVDGKATTRWSSKYTDKEWLYVDLGASYNVNEVKITWQAAYGKDFDVEVSTDASIWTPLQSVIGNTKLVNDLTGLSGTGRYVRLNGKARGTIYGYSIFELEVYGAPATGQQILVAQQAQAAQSSSVVAASTLTVFPNPATTTLIVTLSGVATFPATAGVYDAQGTLLSSAQLTQAGDALDVSKLVKGLYTIRVSSPQTMQTVRLQKD